jgi:hypothetical protein
MDLYPNIWLSDLPDELGNQVVEVVFLLAWLLARVQSSCIQYVEMESSLWESLHR